MENPLHKNFLAPIATEDRRDQTRHRHEMSVTLQVLFPEETFTPVTYTCKTHDVSLRGMRVVLDRLPLTLYNKLLSSTRYARISFTNALNGGKIKLTGRIVWLDYRKPRSTELNGLCYMAVSFDDRDNQDLTHFTEFVQGIQTHSSTGS